MAKLIFYCMVLVTISIVLSLFGLPTISSQILGSVGIGLGNTQNFSSTTLWIAILAGLATLASAAAIKTSFFSVNDPVVFASATFAAATAAVLVGDMVSIITYVNNQNFPQWIAVPIYLFFTPLLVGFGFVLFQWARGDDT